MRRTPFLFFSFFAAPGSSRGQARHDADARKNGRPAYVTMPRRTALSTNSAVLCRSIFSINRQRCVSTVCRLSPSRLAMSLLLLPSASNW
jgi:hypothetical protein